MSLHEFPVLYENPQLLGGLLCTAAMFRRPVSSTCFLVPSRVVIVVTVVVTRLMFHRSFLPPVILCV